MRRLEVQYHEEKLLTIETINGERNVRRVKMEVEVSIDEVDAKTREKQYEYSDSSKVLVNWFEHTTEFDGYSLTLFAHHDPDSDEMNVYLESEDLDLKLRKKG